MRLNGWQRVWVVLAALWGIGVITFAWTEWPQESRIRPFEVTTDEPEPDNRFEILWGGIDVPSKEIAASIRQHSRTSSDPNTRLDLPYIETEYESQIVYFPAGTLDSTVERELRRYDEGVSLERRSHVRTAAILWAAPLIFLYACGVAVAWIVRGFQNPLKSGGS